MPKPIATPVQSAVAALNHHWQLLLQLGREAGRQHLATLTLLTSLGSLLELTGLGLAGSLLLGAGSHLAPQLPIQPTPQQGLMALVLLMLLRGALQAIVALGQERLRSDFTDRLRQQLLAQVLHASANQLNQLGRGELIGLLMVDISRSVIALDQAIRTLQAALSLLLYGAGVLLAGRSAAIPLLLALAATGAAALLQRSDSWQLGRMRTRLNAALQRTVGDGLHGLKAIRAAAAEDWLLQRFSQDNARFRRILRLTVQRQSMFSGLRDSLVVLLVGLWLLRFGSEMPAAAIGTTLVLAYRASSALSAVISAQKQCLGALPGYQQLCERRRMLTPRSSIQTGRVLAISTLRSLERVSQWTALEWHPESTDKTQPVILRPGRLVAVIGPSGCGKTTLLDRVCGLLMEETSSWLIHSADQQLMLAGPAGARQLRQLLAYAPQEAVLFEASLRQNLLLNEEQTTEELMRWLRRLDLTHLVEREGGLNDSLPLALDHFSGGEIHRLGLLRAWLRDCPIEVLDEPTAFLDEASAQQVRSIIADRCRSRMVLVSTHDQHLINQAHQLVHLTAANRSLAEQQHSRHSIPDEDLHG